MKITATNLIGVSIRLLCLGGAIAAGIRLAAPPALAQTPTSSTTLVKGAWQRVYEQLPDFPKVNQYTDLKTKAVNPSNTLASRMIKYHVFVKGRAPNSRLDWKLTVADYLGINEIMYEVRYPGIDELKTNPYDGDLAVIRTLNRSQREALIQAMVTALSPQTPAKSSPILTPTAPTVPNTPNNTNPTTTQPASDRWLPSPKAGDANLLKF